MGLGCVLAALALVAGCKERKEAVQASPQVDEPATAPVPVEPVVDACAPGEHVCVGDAVVQCLATGTPGKTLQTCKDGCRMGTCKDTCATHDVELVYVVDNKRGLYSFDPRKLPDDPFYKIGTLACDARATPFSMAVDRRGVAWVLHDNGGLYRASIIDAQCSTVDYAPDVRAHGRFGMGFVSDGPQATTERLYVAASDDSRMLATIDTSLDTPTWAPIGPLDVKQRLGPEFTGTGDGALYGYFPDDGGIGFIQELDRATGASRGSRMKVGAASGRVGGWAFAHWGGVFYVFVTLDDNSMVHAVDRKTGAARRVRANLPFRIVGAGVSTCAPLLEQVP